MKTGMPSFSPAQLEQRMLDAQQRIQTRAQEIGFKAQLGTLHTDQQYQDMLVTHQQWVNSNAMQSFNPLQIFGIGLAKDRVILNDIVKRAGSGDAEALAQAQANLPALQSLAIGARLGVSFETVKNYLTNAGADCLVRGDLGNFAYLTRALAGLEAATELVPGYERAARSIPTHMRAPGWKSPPKHSKDQLRELTQSVRQGLDAAASTNQTAAEVSRLFSGGRLDAPKHASYDQDQARLEFDRATIVLRPDGTGQLEKKGKTFKLGAPELRAVLDGARGWAHSNQRVGSPPELETLIGRALSADIPPEKRRALREAKSQLVDPRPTIRKGRLTEDPTHPLAARFKLHDVELVKTPKAAAEGTMLIDPGSGSVKVRTEDGQHYDVARDDLMRIYQSLRLKEGQPQGADAFFENLEAAIIRGRQQ